MTEAPEADPVRLSLRDGKVYVDAPWPAAILVAADLLANVDPDHVRFEGDILRFALTNGTAAYQVTERGDGALRFALIEGFFEAPT